MLIVYTYIIPITYMYTALILIHVNMHTVFTILTYLNLIIVISAFEQSIYCYVNIYYCVLYYFLMLAIKSISFICRHSCDR